MSGLLRHYSAKPVTSVRSARQIAEPDYKPRGFWVSVDDGDDGWAEWCRGEAFRLDTLRCVHDITLVPDAKMLRLSNAAEIDLFTAEYGASHFHARVIRWLDVANRYQGIIIAPYVWSRRLAGGASWYYPWDCASGCIWDAAAIQSVELIGRATEGVAA